MNKHVGMKVYILDHGRRWRWMVKFTSSAWTPGQSELSAPQSPSAHIDEKEGRILCPCWKWNVGRPNYNRSLCWLSGRNEKCYKILMRKTDEPSGKSSSGFIDNTKMVAREVMWKYEVNLLPCYLLSTWYHRSCKCSRVRLACLALQNQQRMFAKWADIWKSLDQILIVIGAPNWKIFEQQLQIKFVWKQSKIHKLRNCFF